MDSKRRDNLNSAKTHFNADLTKDFNAKFAKKNAVERNKDFNLGYECGIGKINFCDVPEKIVNDKDFLAGLNHAYREAKIANELYIMGYDAFKKGVTVDKIASNYINNEFYMAGYNDARELVSSNDELEDMHHYGR